MTKSKGKVAVAQQQAGQKAKGPVCCRNCEHADLIQYGDNPVLALCKKKPDDYNKYGWDVDVASSLKDCKMHTVCNEEKCITKLFIVRQHPKACYVTSQTKGSAVA